MQNHIWCDVFYSFEVNSGLFSLSVSTEQDEEICKIQAAIAAGMTANAAHLQAYLKTWDKYREIWEIKKDPFIRRYERLNPPVPTFDADIARCVSHSFRLSKHCCLLVISVS